MKFLDNGETIKKICAQDHNVGADSCRQTGVLTFDENTQLRKKVKICQHLKMYTSTNLLMVLSFSFVFHEIREENQQVDTWVLPELPANVQGKVITFNKT